MHLYSIEGVAKEIGYSIRQTRRLIQVHKITVQEFRCRGHVKFFVKKEDVEILKMKLLLKECNEKDLAT